LQNATSLPETLLGTNNENISAAELEEIKKFSKLQTVAEIKNPLHEQRAYLF